MSPLEFQTYLAWSRLLYNSRGKKILCHSDSVTRMQNCFVKYSYNKYLRITWHIFFPNIYFFLITDTEPYKIGYQDSTLLKFNWLLLYYHRMVKKETIGYHLLRLSTIYIYVLSVYEINEFAKFFYRRSFGKCKLVICLESRDV